MDFSAEKNYKHISAKKGRYELKLRELWNYRDLVFLLTRRSFSVAYKQTILGPAWILVNPLLTVLAHMAVFGGIAGLSTDGVPKILFYLSGTAIWQFFSNCLTANAAVFTGNANLFGKVYFPRLSVPAANSLGALIKLGVQLILLAALMVFFGVKGAISPKWATLWVVPAVIIELGLFGTGVGMLISALTTKYRDLSVLVNVGVGLWMYASPVAYPLSEVGTGKLYSVLAINPISAPIELFRRVLFGQGCLLWSNYAISWAVTIAVLLIGIIIFNRVEKNFMDTV